ncbi:MAG: chemotaxis protein CheA [Alphaproteobacteria bacterium]
MDDLQQFKKTYITECYELLNDMEARLMGLDEEAAPAEELNAIFRCAHSIKGGAGAFGFTNITKFTHILETLLDNMREGKIPSSRQAIDALLKSVDIVTQLVKAADEGKSLPDNFGFEIQVELEAISGMKPTTKPEAVINEDKEEKNEIRIYNISFLPYQTLFMSANEPLYILRELEKLGTLKIKADISKIPSLDNIDPEKCYMAWDLYLETAKTLNEIKEVFEFVEDNCDLKITAIAGIYEEENQITKAAIEVLDPNSNNISKQAPSSNENNKKEEAKDNKPASTNLISSIRVDIEKVDKLVNMVGELVITQAMLVSQGKFLSIDQYPDLISGIEALSQHSRELQEAVMSVRMQPVKSIFSRMPRIVRDLAGQLQKDIKLETFGENTEVDKTVIEQLGDPLTHMIRNAVDHGIETPEIRIAKGKPAQGTIKLSASHQGGRIILEISDDGAGLNREKILKKAKEKNLVEENANLTNEEIDNLIFLPGFSTAEVISNISGRGVGMDVVRRNIEALGGSTKIQTVPGHGSNIIVSLPLTLAILDGMIVRVGNENYIVPISNIIETLRPKAEEVRSVASTNNVINIRGEFVSVIYLGSLFDIKNYEQNPTKALIVLVENGKEKFGLVVDELIGQQQVVIKSLETNSNPVEGISGATILGDGKVSLILDIAKLSSVTKLQNYKITENTDII